MKSEQETLLPPFPFFPDSLGQCYMLACTIYRAKIVVENVIVNFTL